MRLYQGYEGQDKLWCGVIRGGRPVAPVEMEERCVHQAIGHLDLIANAGRPEELWTLLLSAMADYGFDRVTYGFTRQRRAASIGDVQDVLFLSNHAGVGGQDLGFFMRTPMYRWVAGNSGACSWRWAETQRLAGALTEDEIAAMDAARAMGIVAGYSVSFAETSPRAKGAMGLTARPGLAQHQVDLLWQGKGGEILAICNMMHLRITHMPLPIQRRALTPRQREALEWVAEGKTTQDIASIMDVSAAMVEKHLRLAREALDVDTTAHAVAKATMLNHIFAGPAEAMASGLGVGSLPLGKDSRTVQHIRKATS